MNKEELRKALEQGKSYGGIYEASGNPIDETAKMITDEMKKYASDWTYSNRSTAGTYQQAFRSSHRSNCATLANWVLRELGITGSGQYLYGKKGGTIAWSESTARAVREKCDVIHVNQTVRAYMKNLRAGDIVLYEKQHTNIYAGNGKWYETGTVYADGSAREGTRLTRFYGDTVLYDSVISYVIRLRRTFRVQTGEFSMIENVVRMAEKLEQAGIPFLIREI